MRKFFIIAILLPILGSCGKLSELTRFDLNYSTSVTLPATLGINLPFTVYTPSIKTNTESVLQVNDTRKDLIEEVTLKSAVLTITDPAGDDFSFLKSIEVYISADSLEEFRVAWRSGITNDIGDTLHLSAVPDDLKEYIMADSFVLTVKTVTDEILSHDYEVQIDAVFGVDARILGL
ncbi:MAG: hypothetical protein ACOYXB_12960 [Bacteroidota bacterium]